MYYYIAGFYYFTLQQTELELSYIVREIIFVFLNMSQKWFGGCVNIQN